MIILRQATSLTNNLMIEICDKKHKGTPEKNFLIEVSLNGKTTKASAYRKTLKEANAYFDSIMIKGQFIES